MGHRGVHPGLAVERARNARGRARARARGVPVMVLRETADELIPELARYQRTLLASGAAGLLLAAIAGALNPTQFFQSYLMAYMFCLGAPLGCLARGLVHQLSGAAWRAGLRR